MISAHLPMFLISRLLQTWPVSLSRMSSSCDAQTSRDCDTIHLTKYNLLVNSQLKKLDDQFSEIDAEIRKVTESLQVKKEAFVKMYQKDPRISHDVAILRLKKAITDIIVINSEPTSELAYTPTIERKQIVHCKNFCLDRNHNVSIKFSFDMQSVQYPRSRYERWGYCFINHPKINNNTVLTWSIRVPMFNGYIGIVIITACDFQ